MPKLNEAPVEVPGTKKLTGTFTFPPPLCIGEPFVEANKRGGKDERSKGKQLIGGPMRGTAAFPGNFSVIPFLYVVCYVSLNNLDKAKTTLCPHFPFVAADVFFADATTANSRI
jgi:hypothetical protein